MNTTQTEKIGLTIGGMDVTIPARKAVLAYLREVLDEQEISEALPPFSFREPLPKIGDPYEGGIYAGRLHDGDHLYDLIASPKTFELAPGNWQKAVDAATASVIGAYNDWKLPTRAEALCLFERLHSVTKGTAEAFEEAWYWTSQIYERYADYAWIQSFYDGHPDYNRRDGNDCRARFVRRKIIQ